MRERERPLVDGHIHTFSLEGRSVQILHTYIKTIKVVSKFARPGQEDKVRMNHLATGTDLLGFFQKKKKYSCQLK